MEKSRTRIAKFYPIIICIPIIALISLSFLDYNDNINLNTEINNLKNILTKKTEKSLEIDDDKKELVKKIEELNNIEENIQLKRKEVFSLASKLEQKITSGEAKKKIAYLTFDDGPYYSTYKFLDVLKSKNVKATFFTTNVNKTNCYDNKSHNCHQLYKEYAKANHTIANHTYTHAIFKGLYTSVDSFVTAVKNQQNLIYEETGLTTNILRFPGGSSTPGKTKGTQMKNKIYEMGYGWVDWTAQDGDGGDLRSTSQAWSTFTSSINENIEVVLFHDYNQYTLSILPKAIDYLRDKGYILLPLFYESIKVVKG